ncbi:MAG: phage minor head protein, partial [Pseudolabrys sp.]
LSLLRANARGDDRGRMNAMERVARTIGQTMTLADLFGRRRVWLEIDAAPVGGQPEFVHFEASPVVPHVPFSEAYDDLLRREPRLAENAAEVANLYETKHAFALARSADKELTSAVERFIAKTVQSGKPAPAAAQIIADMGDWTRAYAGTVYRTNLNTAYTAGRFQQAQEPGVREILPAFERYSIHDSAVRQGRPRDGGENHLAASGLVADTRDAVWRRAAPPSGYGCRCGVRLVPRVELRRRGLLEGDRVLRYEPPGFAAFAPHPNFGRNRPDFDVYLGSIG